MLISSEGGGGELRDLLDPHIFADIDECLEGRHTCDSKAICNNTNGGFECTCLLGYEGDGFVCESKYIFNALQREKTTIDSLFLTDIDECEVETHKCHEDAECIDSDGSFSCVCKLGFSGDGLLCERKELYCMCFIA